MKNFKEYFAEDNSCNLEENFNVERRLEQSKKLRDDTITHFQKLTMKTLDEKTVELLGESTMINFRRL